MIFCFRVPKHLKCLRTLSSTVGDDVVAVAVDNTWMLGTSRNFMDADVVADAVQAHCCAFEVLARFFAPEV